MKYDFFKRGEIVKVKVNFFRRLLPMRTHAGKWVWIPSKILIHGYREDMVAWEGWARQQQWFFVAEKLESYEPRRL